MKIFESGDGSQQNSLRQVLRRLDRADGRQAVAFRVVFAAIDVAILAFFLLGPYLRSGPSYLIIDYAIAVWIAAEMVGRAIAAASVREWIRRPMTWIDFVVLATLLLPDLLFNFAFLRIMRFWAIGTSPLLKDLLRKAGYLHLLDVVRAVINFLVFLFMATGFVYTCLLYTSDAADE